MKQAFFLLLCLWTVFNAFAQGTNSNTGPNRNNNTTAQKKAPLDLYKIISADRDTTLVDTTLTINKAYQFNYLRRDRFELLPFANVGQAYTSLAYDFQETHLIPKFAGQAHHFNYYGIEDMRYFQVPTPFTELYFKTAFEQGQQLDALFSVNTSERLNMTIAYKGVRSLGNYQNALTSTGNFRFTTHYTTKNKRYTLRAHLAAQDIFNEENGGLQETSLPLFVNGDPDFQDRGRLEVNFEDADNLLKGIRYYVDQEYQVVQRQDSTATTQLVVGNSVSYEEKLYRYTQDSPFDGFGPSFQSSGLRDEVRLQDFNASVYTRLSNSTLGTVKGFINYNSFNYGYNQVFIQDDSRITNRLKGGVIQAGGAYQKQYKGFLLDAKAGLNVAGAFTGSYLKGTMSFDFTQDISAQVGLHLQSVAPNFNLQLYQSDYEQYNWQNNFDNVNTQVLSFGINSKRFGNASFVYSGIENYTFFNSLTVEEITGETTTSFTVPTPEQSTERVDYLQIKWSKTFAYQNFRLANTVLFQNVGSGSEALKVPTVVTRNSLYYQDHWFKKALFLQTGVHFNYFTEYEMNAYDPVLAEFYVQDSQTLGGFPVIDLFFNAKVRQTRIFFAYEHFNALFTNTSNYFSAPGYPYRDPILRFGLVWNFFL